MRGADYVIKRTAFAVATVFVALTLNFILFRTLPGSAVTSMARVPRSSPALKAALTHEFGLDKSKWEQYLIYFRELFHGNLGISFANEQPVATNLRQDLVNTIPMVALGTIFAIVFGIITGVISAARRGTMTDHSSTMSALAFYSVPTQWLGLMLIIVFAGRLPAGGMIDNFLFHPSFWQHVQDVLKHMALPSLTLGLTFYGEYTLIVRSTMLETLGEDYILTARAKGLSRWRIVRRHALRNAMLPTATLVALSLGYVVAGAILVETVFSWPGIGRAVYE
ncbi:MAG: ABC transporter permease, partial [Actinomycetota bacterium]|nr:ABC transporter permease [Actinomycetota bacterium]